MTHRRMAVAAVAGTAVLLVGGWTGSSAAQIAPTITVSPASVGANQSATVTVTGCATAPEVSASHQFDDVVEILPPLTDAGGGTWTHTQVDVDISDIHFTLFSGQCGLTEPLAAVLDVEHPMIVQGPVNGVAVTTLLGTDCPPGTEAAVTLTAPGERTELVRPIDERGDWRLDVAHLSGPVTVDATCGTVSYDRVEFVGASPVPAPPTTVPPSAPPAAPLAFTG